MKANEYKKKYTSINGCVADHLGNYYVTTRNMCNAWGIQIDKFRARMRADWSVKDALTRDNSKTTPDVDDNVIWVFGEPFASYAHVDRAYGYAENVAHKHKDDLEDWLMSHGRFFVDNKLFRTFTALSLEYGVGENNILQRLKNGWSLYDAVHRPLDLRGRPGEPTKDHTGVEYASKAEMVRHYNLTRSCYNKRISKGWSLERTLTTPMKVYESVASTRVESLAKRDCSL